MFKLDPNLVYKLPPVRELPTLDAQAIPEDWLVALTNLTKESLEPQLGVHFAERIDAHVGDAATYTMKQQVLDALQVIYSVMVDPSTTRDSRAAIAFKLVERAEFCSPGFHDGVNAILEGFVRPQSMDELLYRVRRDLVSKTANQLTDEVHANNRVFTVAQIAGLGVRSLNPDDVHVGSVSDEVIREKLKDAFNKEYTLFNVMSHLAEEVNSELITLGYTSETIAQDKLETCIAFLTDVFKDSPAVVRQGEAREQDGVWRVEYTQRINDFKTLSRENLQRLGIALRSELMDALITNDAKMPAILKMRLDQSLSQLSSENKDVINRIQHQYRQLLESEEMRHLAAQMNEAKQRGASPFAMRAEDEYAGVRLNWPQIQTAIWQVFRDQGYVILNSDEKRLLNRLLDSTEQLDLGDANSLALNAGDLLRVLTLGIVSDEKKEVLIHAYLDKRDEDMGCKLSTLQTIDKMSEERLSINAAIKEALQTHITSLLRKQWFDQRGIDLSNPIGNFSLTGYEPEYIRCYKPYVLLAVQRNGIAFYRASAALKGDKDVVLAAVRQDGRALEYASEALKGDRDVVLAAVRQDGSALGYASEALIGDRDVVIAAVQKSGFALHYASKALKGDRDVVLAAVRQDGRALQPASAALRDDRDVVLAAVRQDGRALRCVSAALRGDRDVVLAAVQKDVSALYYASAALRDDRDFVLAAVQKDVSALTYASEALKGDRGVVLAAVQKDGRALYYASAALKGDRDFVLAAVKRNVHAFGYASEALKGDRDVVLAAVRENGRALYYASEGLKGDKNVVLAAIQWIGVALQYASEALRDDRDVVLVAVQRIGAALQYASEALKGERDVVLAAVRQDGSALTYASEALRDDRDIVLVAVQRIGGALYYASAGLKGDKAVVLAAVRQDGSALEYASEALRGDKDIVLAAVKSLIEQGKVIPTQEMVDVAKRQEHTELVQCLTNAMSSQQAALIEPQDATEVREAQKSMKSALDQQRGDDPLEPGYNHLSSP